MKSNTHPENYRLVAFKDMSNNDVLKSKLFDEIMSGKKLCALAHEESSHHSPNIDLSIISKKNEKFILNGKKRFVIDG